jgi:uncharacterized protein DUF5367
MWRFVWIGAAVWLLATLAIRLWGQSVFRTRSAAEWALLFGVAAVVIAVPISLLVRRLPTREAGLRAVVLIAMPGMLLDTGSVLWFRSVFPNLPEMAGMPFAALLLWAYAVALLAGAWPRRVLGSS